jgi:methylmalonyl-CoA/ethylmalonyl-CoA epimerase
MIKRTILAAFLASTCVWAQLPDFYKKVGRLTWVVKDVDRAVNGWSKLGLSGVEDYGEVDFPDTRFRGKPVQATFRIATGFLGDVAVDFFQPARGENAFTEFLAKHGEGIFGVFHAVSSDAEFNREVERMRTFGVGVLQQASVEHDGGITRYAYFDTRAQGKYGLGIIHNAPGAGSYGTVKLTQVAFVVRDPEAVSAYWSKLGFPALSKTQSKPRGMRYRGKPVSYPLDLWWQRHTSQAYEWTVPLEGSVYAEFAQAHGEGIQHLGIAAEDMDKAIAEYEKLGFPVIQSGAWGEEGKKGSGRFAYMDTESIGGVHTELLWSFR